MSQAFEVSAQQQEAATEKFLEWHPEFPRTEAAAKLVGDRLNRLMEQGLEFSPMAMHYAYEQLVVDGAISPADAPMPMEKFQRLTTAEMETYLRSKGAL